MNYHQLIIKLKYLKEEMNYEILGSEEYEALMQQIDDINEHLGLV